VSPEDRYLFSFIECAPDAVVVFDDTGSIVLLNSLLERMFQYSAAELATQNVDRLFCGQMAAVLHDIVAADNPASAISRELVGRRQCGKEFPVEISVRRTKCDGRTLCICIVRDISRRVEAEAKFSGLLQSAPDGIVVVDADGIIVIANTQAERMFGYERSELIGRPVEMLVPDRYSHSHVAQRQSYVAAPRTRPMGAGRALTGKRKDGTELPVEISLSPQMTESGLLVTSIIRDISERRRAEEQLKASLREKEVLLREIHHRVKNNLQVTSSLLKLQSNSVQDSAAREMFEESRNRIRAMALVHEKLYQSTDLSRINMSEYLEALAALLIRSYGTAEQRVKLELSGTGVLLPIEAAIPCGLILNELISNCLKHAFSGRDSGLIRTSVQRVSPHMLALSVADNGNGLPSGADPMRAETLGLRLVQALAEQLQGRISVHSSGAGTEITVVFAEPEKKSE